MAKSPFSSAGGGDADTNPHSFAARKCGGSIKRAAGGRVLKEAEDKKSIGIIDGDGENVKPRLDRKRGGKACKDGGATKFIDKAIKRPGALHEATHTPKGEKIPEKKIVKAEHSSNERIRKEAQFAEELKGFRKGKK